MYRVLQRFCRTLYWQIPVLKLKTKLLKKLIILHFALTLQKAGHFQNYYFFNIYMLAHYIYQATRRIPAPLPPPPTTTTTTQKFRLLLFVMEIMCQKKSERIQIQNFSGDAHPQTT